MDMLGEIGLKWDIPQSEDEARHHIAEIRAAKRLDDADGDVSDLENALVILAEQLYEKSTHFLLELIQNADDNNYEASVIPTLSITLSGPTLRIDCNEIGFGRRNTEAICKIGRSTKGGLDKSKGYIGEKGIGFKSIFKIADVVWIQSGHYSFKFDKHAKLGMIAPIWTSFPCQSKAGLTSMYLQLAKDCDIGELLHEIKSLDARLLIFLRQLREINITVQEQGASTWKRRLKCQKDSSTVGEELITLHNDDEGRLYKIIRHPVSNLPPEPKRPNHHQSEILLAFPLDIVSLQPIIEPQNVYAFLPIRDYGFKFLLQADFLLVASRADIDSSSRWNRALLKNIPDAFRRAVHEFNQSGDLRYSWIEFLGRRSPFLDFFTSLEQAVFQVLADSSIIESQAGELVAPSKLKMVCFTIFGNDGHSFNPSEIAKTKYVSPRYPFSYQVEDSLSALGVKKATPDDLIEDLGILIESSPEEFQRFSPLWHSSLCEYLLGWVNYTPSRLDQIAEMKIIPLKSGQWVSSREQPLYFIGTTSARNIAIQLPDGIPLFEIDSQAASNRWRQQLFVRLGAQTWTNEKICQAIISTHASSSFLPQLLPREVLVSHLMVLFRAGWTDAGRWTDVQPASLWLSTESGSVRVSHETYIDSDKLGSASTQFRRYRESFSFVHGDYMNLVPQERQPQLREWMIANLGVAEHPRLVARTPSTVGLSKDFRFLLDNSNYLSVLLLLRDCWEFYAMWIVENQQDRDTGNHKKKQEVREAISNLSVSCKGGGSARLRETMLPTHGMTTAKNTSFSSFIDLPDPENPQWRKLSHFGVVVDPGIGPFMKSLETLKESGHGTLEKTSEVYMQIYLQCNADRSLIEVCKKRFESEALIFAPRSESSSRNDWMKLRSCVWEGPSCLRKTACLTKFYYEHYPFFCSMLGLRQAEWTDLADEASKIEAFDTLDYISELFVSLSEQLKTLEDWQDARALVITALTTSTIFPIDEGKSQGVFDYLETSRTDATWFIADRPHLKHAFHGLVPILALSEEAIGKIGPLIRALDWNRRLLSRLARGIPQAGGDTQLNYRYTKAICSKARFIVRLLPSNLETRVEIIEQMCNAKVYTVEKITLQWAIKTPENDVEVVGRADSGRVKISGEGKVLEVFLRKADSDISRPPFELLEELATFCQLTDPSHVALLHWVMSEANLGEIATVFERRGLQNDVPEIEALTESLELNPHFWGKLSGKSQDKSTTLENEAATLDAVSSFMDRFHKTNKWEDIKSQEWSKVDTDLVLSHLCRLENVDPYSLLPQTSESPWDQRLRQGGGFIDDPTSISFMHLSPNAEASVRAARLFPATIEITRTSGIQINVLPDTTADVAIDTIVAGETYVSKLFERELGDAYQPQTHWTSSFRGKSGLAPFTGDSMEASTFTIGDKAGSAAFTQMLVRKGNFDPGRSDEFPVYHIEVTTTDESLLAEFALEPTQVQKAWKCHKNRKTCNADNVEVFVLIRISDVQEDPHVALFVDPWQMHAEGNLRLRSESRYLAQFETNPPFILLDTAHNSISSEEVRQSRKRKWPSSRKDTVLNTSQVGSSRPSPESLYRYIPLKLRQIRLLELLPGRDDEAIRGFVRHVSPDKKPKYRAVSYVWGPALKPFYFNTTEGNIAITASLHAALKRFRSAKESTFIWADAICIDQSNISEKASQIRMLPAIFQSAESVLAWIGDAEDNSHQALETLLQIRTNAVKPDVWPAELPRIPSDWQHPGLPPTKSKIWPGIVALCEREWFKRAWVIQEVVRAADVRFVCGAWDIAWDDIYAAIELCVDWSSTLGVADARLREMLSALKPVCTLGQTRTAFRKMRLSPRFSMLALLEDFAHARSTKECDKFFALLGISFDTEAEAFNPDYTSTIETIARRYAAEFVSRGDAMDLLYRSGTSKSYSFSSWIPNWSSNEPCRTISTWRGARGIFSAGGTHSKDARLGKHKPDHLRVTGSVIDTIAGVGRFTTAEVDLITVINSLSDIIDELGDYPTGESKRELMLKIPIGNATLPCGDDVGSLQAAAPEGEDGEHINFHWNDVSNDVKSLQDMIGFFKQNRDERDTTWKYWRTAAAFFKRLSDGRFFWTDRGYIGIGPKEIVDGDQICVFPSGRVPFLLEEKYDTHRLIGECYVHGIMYGESSAFIGVEKQCFVMD